MKPMKWMLSILIAGGLVAQTFAGPKKCVDKVCRTVPETQKEEKYCWEVECKEICIPKVRFPWQTCQPPACGRVRLVHTYKKRTREVEKAGYKWEIEARPCPEPCVAVPLCEVHTGAACVAEPVVDGQPR